MASVGSWGSQRQFIALGCPLTLCVAQTGVSTLPVNGYHLVARPDPSTPKVVSCQPKPPVAGKLRRIEHSLSKSEHRSVSLVGEARISHAVRYAAKLCALKPPKLMNSAGPFTRIAIC